MDGPAMTTTNAPVVRINQEYPFQTTFNIKHFILDICHTKNITQGQLEFSFIDEKKMTALNKKHLQHDNPRATLSFNLGSTQIPDADIYICIPVAEQNAPQFKTTFEEELKLLIIHTLLHTIGYKDYTPEEKKEMDTEQTRLLNILSKHKK